MKQGKKIFGIIALIAMVGISFAGCPGEDTSDPALTGTVSISGDAQVDETLTAVITSLGGTGTITYQWKAGSDVIGTNSSTYVVQADDIGKTITVTVTRAGYSGGKISSPTAAVVPAGDPVLTGTLSISNNWIGEKPSVDISGLNGTGVLTITWELDDDVIDIDEYTIPKADHGKKLRVKAEREGYAGYKVAEIDIVWGWMVKTYQNHQPGEDDRKNQNMLGLAIDSEDNLYFASNVAYTGDRIIKLNTSLMDDDYGAAYSEYASNDVWDARYTATGPDNAVFIKNGPAKEVLKFPQPGGNYEFKTDNIMQLISNDNYMDGDLAVDKFGSIYAISQYEGPFIAKISADGQTITKFHTGEGADIGKDNEENDKKFQYPLGGITCDPDGNIYVCDGYNDGRIRKITPAGEISTFVGGDWGNPFELMRGLTYGNDGNFYVVSERDWSIQKITPDGTVTRVAGGNGRDNEDGLALAEAKFKDPWGIAVAADGTIYVVDKSEDEWNFVGVSDGWDWMSYYCIRKIYFDNE